MTGLKVKKEKSPSLLTIAVLDLLFCFSPINYFLLTDLDLCAGGRGAVQGTEEWGREGEVAPWRGSQQRSPLGHEAARAGAGPDLVPWEGPGSPRGVKKGWGPALFLQIPRRPREVSVWVSKPRTALVEEKEEPGEAPGVRWTLVY